MTKEQAIQYMQQHYPTLFEPIDKDGNLMFELNHPKVPKFRMVFVEGGSGKIEQNDQTTQVQGFLMAETQVTQELYIAVMDENLSSFKGTRRPVERVSWRESVAFCMALNKKLKLTEPATGYTDDAKLNTQVFGFRLPTEAEWEYAAGGGQAQAEAYAYAGSNTLHQVGWYYGNNSFETRPVGL